jgi:GNAT superfamily N-acetyltransferase
MSDKDLNLRLYEKRDIPRVVDLVMLAIPQLPNYSMITPVPERIQYVLEHQIGNGLAFGGWVLCDSHDVVQGFGGAWCVQSLMSYDYVADDVFFWIAPEYRTYRNADKLYKVMVDWARSKGAKLIRASHTGGSFPPDSREGKLYDALLKRQGFRNIGNIYHWHSYGER